MRFANRYTATFLPLGWDHLVLERSVRQDVKIFWMTSAASSTIDFFSPDSSPVKSPWILAMNSGWRVNPITKLDRDSDNDKLVWSSMTPYVGLASALAQELAHLSTGQDWNGQGWLHTREGR